MSASASYKSLCGFTRIIFKPDIRTVIKDLKETYHGNTNTRARTRQRLKRFEVSLQQE